MSPSRKDTADQTTGSIDRRSFLTTGAAVAGTAAAISAAPAQAQEMRWDREADVVVIGAGAGGLLGRDRGAREGRLGHHRREEFRHRRPRHDELRRPLYRRRQPAAEGEAGRNDTPDLVFADWSRPEKPMGRFSDRDAGAHLCRQQSRPVRLAGEARHQMGRLSRPAPDRLDRARTRLNVVPVAERSDQPRPRLRLRAAAGEDRARDGHRDPAAAAHDQDPPRAAAVRTRHRHLGDRGRRQLPATRPRR